jgi:hypothetical protein
VAFVEDQLKELLYAKTVEVLIDSLTLNIELIERVVDLISPEQRASAAVQETLQCVEDIKTVRGLLLDAGAPQ